MRIAVIADIHGNLPALQAVLADNGHEPRSQDQPWQLLSGPLWPREVWIWLWHRMI